ncbi:MAG: 50S ribosomal protein L4 [Patescibacteria group bacterium]
METKIYNQEGKETGKINLPTEIFDLSWNDDLVHQVVVSMTANKRNPIAHTKNRGEVSGGGKKPWRQKGTGRARHGSIRSPLWRGGGITFGPTKDKNYSKKINKKMKIKAFYTVLAQKMRDKEILFVDDIKFANIKTKEAKKVLENFSKIEGFGTMLNKKRNSACIALHGREEAVEKSFHNFANIFVNEMRNLNPVDILKYKYLVITHPNESLEFLIGKKLTLKAKEVKKNAKPKIGRVKKTVK